MKRVLGAHALFLVLAVTLGPLWTAVLGGLHGAVSSDVFDAMLVPLVIFAFASGIAVYFWLLARLLTSVQDPGRAWRLVAIGIWPLVEAVVAFFVILSTSHLYL